MCGGRARQDVEPGASRDGFTASAAHPPVRRRRIEATEVLKWLSLSIEGLVMRDRDLLGEISGRLTGLLQSGGAAAGELRGKIEEQLREGVAELSAIDREEFDAQVRALQRAEERIQALEETVAELERRLAEKDAPSAE